MRHLKKRGTGACLLAAAALLVNGCAGTPEAPSPDLRSRFGKIGVVALPAHPKGDFLAFAESRPGGTAKGVAAGALEGWLDSIQTMGPSAGGGMSPAVAGLGMLLGVVIGAVAGGIGGAARAVPAETASRIHEQVDDLLAKMNLNQALAADVHKEAASRPELFPATVAAFGNLPPDRNAGYRFYADTGVQTILEVNVTEAGFRGGSGAAPVVSFYLTARIRMVNAGDDAELYRRDFSFTSAAKPYQKWLENDSAALQDGFRFALADLAVRIFDELFIVTAFPFDSNQWDLPGAPDYGICWLSPVYPPYRQRSFSESFFSAREKMIRDWIEYTPTDSCRPTLRWEAFPRPQDYKDKNRRVIEGIDQVTYDLKIWEVKDDRPGSLAYDRTGLIEPVHRIEYPLKAHTRYFWSFRARYRLFGKLQATRWAFSMIPATGEGIDVFHVCDMDNIPPSNYFRFITP